ncbi:ovomucoid-like [Notamacropus eugenii]|uniref:ovomucoid-like n=1 Tax=Notamacropus eugenii TaxID=9315 RepID=UPI003B67604C
MAFLSPTTKTLLGLFIFILYVFAGVFSKLKEHPTSPTVDLRTEKQLCLKYSRKTGPCPEEYNPICGKDDVTYVNLCYFCWTFWHTNPGRACVRNFGPCPESDEET